MNVDFEQFRVTELIETEFAVYPEDLSECVVRLLLRSTDGDLAAVELTPELAQKVRDSLNVYLTKLPGGIFPQ